MNRQNLSSRQLINSFMNPLAPLDIAKIILIEIGVILLFHHLIEIEREGRRYSGNRLNRTVSKC